MGQFLRGGGRGGRGARDSPQGSRDAAGENWVLGQVSQVN